MVQKTDKVLEDDEAKNAEKKDKILKQSFTEAIKDTANGVSEYVKLKNVDLTKDTKSDICLAHKNNSYHIKKLLSVERWVETQQNKLERGLVPFK